jgi:NAD(P)-dependent dehydrogenase (short-subunit alcohol dehydrogenase family)
MLRLDLGDEASIRAAVDELLRREGRLDVLVNNAGLGIAGPLEQLQLDNVRRVFDANVLGLLRVCQAALPVMRRQGSGRIINISSIGAVVGLPFRGAYCASKAAVDTLSETLRLEVEPFGIEVCSVRAGDIRTPINQHRIMDYDPESPAYGDTFRRVAAAINEEVDHGMAPEAVARQIGDLLDRRHLPPTVAVGKWLQRSSIRAKRLLPGRWFEAIIRSYTKQ